DRNGEDGMRDQDRQINWPKPLRISELSPPGVIVVDEIAGQKKDRGDESSHHAIAVSFFFVFPNKDVTGRQQNRARSIQKSIDRRQIGQTHRVRSLSRVLTAARMRCFESGSVVS